MVNNMQKNYFESSGTILKTVVLKSSKKEFAVSSMADALNYAAGKKYLAAVYMHNEIRFGYYDGSDFKFADDNKIEERYLIELRLFNDNEEILIQKKYNEYAVRIITDNEGEDLRAVDSSSVMFGEAVYDESMPQKFARLKELGRKIEIVIPAVEKAQKYMLSTRSYIGYDKTTGQAGFAYYRWLAVTKA